MKILFLVGVSGSGKTTIANKLCEDTENYNLINSFTDREMREKGETGHTFISPSHMDMIIEHSGVVAKTDIHGKRYCSLESQFNKEKINVYVVDVNGMNDTIKYFPTADIMSILIQRKDIEVDCVRAGRDVAVPMRNDVDFCIENDYKIESAVNVIKVLVGFDLFKKPSHRIQTASDKIKEVEKQERYLRQIKESLFIEVWQANHQAYLNLIKYLKEKLNEEFDFDLDIKSDSEPEIYDGELDFNIIITYEDNDIMWGDIHNVLEKATYYSHSYCKEHNYNELSTRLRISESYEGAV